MSKAQLSIPNQKIHPCLWFDGQAHEAATFYTSLFKNSRITSDSTSDVVVSFILDGQDFTALNGGPKYKHTPAMSLFTICEDQAEIDYLWEQFTKDGGSEVQCGWVTDKFGVSWQIVPRVLLEMFHDPDKEKAARAHDAMLKSVKFDIETLKAAFEGKGSAA
jgi:predicted 3-demethylubiquinone-9 3-methyltransferase (glyoxalase superfamily)